MFQRKHLLALITIFFFFTSTIAPVTLTAKDTKASDERDRAMKAAEVLDEIMGIPEGGIPNELMERADAIAVIPHVVKGAFGVGGRYGKGLISRRDANGRWS